MSQDEELIERLRAYAGTCTGLEPQRVINAAADRLEALAQPVVAVPMIFYDSSDRSRRLNVLADLIEAHPEQHVFAINNIAALATDLRALASSPSPVVGDEGRREASPYPAPIIDIAKAIHGYDERVYGASSWDELSDKQLEQRIGQANAVNQMIGLAILSSTPVMSVSGERSPELVEVIREWIMSTDHPVSDWECQFAEAIRSMMRASGWVEPDPLSTPVTEAAQEREGLD